MSAHSFKPRSVVSGLIQSQQPKRTAVALSIFLTAALSAPLAHAEDLLQSYELAKASDPQLRLAQASRGVAQEQVVQARSALMPQINAQTGLTYSRNNFPLKDPITRQNVGSGEGTSDGSSYSANLNQTIYDHANYTRLKAARAQAEATDATYRSAEQALLVRVANAYFQVLTTQDSVSSAQAEEKAVGRQLEQAEQRFNVGLTAITDVHEARARHDGAVAAAILAENSLDDAQAALTELTGKNIDKIALVKPEIPLLPPSPADWQSWVDTAIQSSPTIAARTAESLAAAHSLDSSKAARFPTITSSAGYNNSTTNSRTDRTLSTGTSDRRRSEDENDGYNIGLTVNVPIFSGFATSSRIRQAVLDSEASKDRLEQERRTVTRSTRNAYRSVIAGVSEVKARQQALVSAKSALEATEAGFEVGTRTIVDVLLSQQVLFQAQRDYSAARHNFLVNGLRLKASAGIITPSDLQAVNALLEVR